MAAIIVSDLSDNIISASGGWAATPQGGPIIFNGTVQFLGEGPEPGATVYILNIGKFIVTSKSEVVDPNGTRTTCGITCIIGWVSRTGGYSGLGKCIKLLDTFKTQDVINDLCGICGLPIFAVPGASKFINETVWIKEGQSAYSLLTEIVTACGCVFYSIDGNSIICETLSDFISNFATEPTGDIIEYSALANSGAKPSGAKIEGVSKTTTALPAILTSTNTVVQASFNDSGATMLPVTTTITKNFNILARTSLVETEVTSPDPFLNSKTIVEEIYETKVEGNSEVPYDVRSCYPNDNARLKNKKTTILKSDGLLYDNALKEFIGSLNLSKNNWITHWGITETIDPTMLAVETLTEENWTYDTKPEKITFGLPLGASADNEEVRYEKHIRKAAISLAGALSNSTGGTNPDFLTNNSSAIVFGDSLKDVCFTFYNELLPAESEYVTWIKRPGSNRWSMSRELYRAHILINPQLINSNLKKYIQHANVNNIKGAAFFNGYLALRLVLQNKAKQMILVEKQEEMDSSPSTGSKYPSERETYEESWTYRMPLGGNGGVISFSAGNYIESNAAITAVQAIAELEVRKQFSKTATVYGSVFKVGDCESPSFSMDVNGIKSTGVFL